MLPVVVYLTPFSTIFLVIFSWTALIVTVPAWERRLLQAPVTLSASLTALAAPSTLGLSGLPFTSSAACFVLLAALVTSVKSPTISPLLLNVILTGVPFNVPIAVKVPFAPSVICPKLETVCSVPSTITLILLPFKFCFHCSTFIIAPVTPSNWPITTPSPSTTTLIGCPEDASTYS